MPEDTEAQPSDGQTATLVQEPASPPADALPAADADAGIVEPPSDGAADGGEPEPVPEPEPGQTQAEYDAQLKEWRRRAEAAEQAQRASDKRLAQREREIERQKREWVERQNAAERERLIRLAKEDPDAFANEWVTAATRGPDPEQFRDQIRDEERQAAVQEYVTAFFGELRRDGPFAALSQDDRERAIQAAIESVQNDPQRIAEARQYGMDAPAPTYADVLRHEAQILIGRKDEELTGLRDRVKALEAENQGLRVRGNPGPEETPPGSGGGNSYRTQVEAEMLFIQRKISAEEMLRARSELPYN